MVQETGGQSSKMVGQLSKAVRLFSKTVEQMRKTVGHMRKTERMSRTVMVRETNGEGGDSQY